MNGTRAFQAALLLAAAGTSFQAAHAQTSLWKIDPVHSGVEFQIKHLGVSTVRGTFAKPTGMVHLDDKDVSHSSVEASIDVSTVNTNDTGRDNHLKSPEFFNAAQNPTITFKSTAITKAPDGKLQMVGDLTIAGVTKPVTLSVDGPAAPQKGMHGETVSGLSATGTLSRRDFNFGQKYGPPMIGDDVKFSIDIEMDKQ